MGVLEDGASATMVMSSGFHGKRYALDMPIAFHNGNFQGKKQGGLSGCVCVRMPETLSLAPGL